MGGSSSRQDIENQMSLIKLQRMEIQVEKEKALKKLSEMEGGQIQRSEVPDYIDPAFAKQKNILNENQTMEEENKDNKNPKVKNKINKKTNKTEEIEPKDRKEKRNKNKDKISKGGSERIRTDQKEKKIKNSLFSEQNGKKDKKTSKSNN